MPAPSDPTRTIRRALTGAALSATLLLSACGGSPVSQARQEVETSCYEATVKADSTAQVVPAARAVEIAAAAGNFDAAAEQACETGIARARNETGCGVEPAFGTPGYAAVTECVTAAR